MPTLSPDAGNGLPLGAREAQQPGGPLARTGVNPPPLAQEEDHASQESAGRLPVRDDREGLQEPSLGGEAGAGDPRVPEPGGQEEEAEEGLMAHTNRFVLNTETGILHDRNRLTEQCNTDDIKVRYRFSTNQISEAHAHLAFRRGCKWCKPERIVKVQNPFPTPEEDAGASAPA
jgi:hypothetical protein